MKNLLQQFRTDLKEEILGILWSAWSQLGIMGGAGKPQGIVDLEALLLLTFSCAREDPRLFDEVIDWLHANGEWINVTRLATLIRQDATCDETIVGAIAACLAEHDSSAKWRAMVKRYKPESPAPKPLFLRNGASLKQLTDTYDQPFIQYGWQRSPRELRGLSQAPNLENPAAFMLLCRSFFSVNMRADIWAWLMFNRKGTASQIARELGYTQRRVHEALNGMYQAGAFHARREGNRKEYTVIPDRGWPLPNDGSPVAWRDWRAFSRSVMAVWKHAFAMKEEGVTSYILDAEIAKATESVRNDFSSAGIPLQRQTAAQTLRILGAF